MTFFSVLKPFDGYVFVCFVLKLLDGMHNPEKMIKAVQAVMKGDGRTLPFWAKFN